MQYCLIFEHRRRISFTQSKPEVFWNIQLFHESLFTLFLLRLHHSNSCHWIVPLVSSSYHWRHFWPICQSKNLNTLIKTRCICQVGAWFSCLTITEICPRMAQYIIWFWASWKCVIPKHTARHLESAGRITKNQNDI